MSLIGISRRFLLRSGLLGGGLAGSLAAARAATPHAGHGNMTTVGTVDHAANGFDPHEVLTDWDTGVRSTDAQGRAVRTFEVTAEDKEIEIAPGIRFPAWTYNGRVPGPTLRVTEDRKSTRLNSSH